MFRSLFFIALISMLAIACQNATNADKTERKNGFTPVLKSPEDSLYHDVMQGHDAAMAKMGRLRKYIDQVQHALDSINKLPSQKTNISYQHRLIDLQKELNNADNDMNTWMEGF